MTSCPTCGAELRTRNPKAELSEIRMGPVERCITDALSAAYPRALDREALVTRVYEGSREPENADSVVSTVIYRLRHKITPFGWVIPRERSGRGARARYRLECDKSHRGAT